MLTAYCVLKIEYSSTTHAQLQVEGVQRKQELKVNTVGYVYANFPPTGANDSIFTGVSASSIHAAMPPMPLLGD